MTNTPGRPRSFLDRAMDDAAKHIMEEWRRGYRLKLDEARSASATIARAITEGRGTMDHTARADRLMEAKRAHSIGSASSDLRAIAGSLIVIAEQGEEKLSMFRERHAIGMAPHKPSSESQRMMEAAIGRAVGDDEGYRNEIKPAIQLKSERDRAYELGFQDGERAERAKIDRNRETGFSRGFEAAKAMYKPASGATKELIDAALAVDDQLLGRRNGPPGPAYDRLIAAARNYRQLVNEPDRQVQMNTNVSSRDEPR